MHNKKRVLQFLSAAPRRWWGLLLLGVCGAGHSPAFAAATAPAAPTGLSAKLGANHVALAFVPPTTVGSSAVVLYTATCTDGALKFVGSSASSPVVVAGLTQQVNYACTISASNSQLNSPESAPLTVNLPSPPSFTVYPSEPQNVTATAGNGSVILNFTKPLTDGGFPIVGYNAVCSGGSATGAQALSSPIIVGGLKNGKSYTCSVAAINAQGAGTSSLSVSATPLASLGGATVPSVPQAVSAVAGNGQITLNFTAPSSTGGSPITSYAATCNNGTGTRNISNSVLKSPVVVSGLTNGMNYACSVVATNLYGNSLAATATTVMPSASLVNKIEPAANIVVSATVPSLAADGTTGVITHVKTASGALYSGSVLTINLTSRCAGAGMATLTNSVTVINGVAEAVYQPKGCAGVDTVTATLAGSTLTASTRVVVSTTGALSPKAALGKLMFFDAALSANGKQSCASCHSPARQYLAPNALPTQLGGVTGQAVGLRAAPSAAYAALAPAFRFLSTTNKEGTTDAVANGKFGTPLGGLMWDGRQMDVFQQAKGPLVAPQEMANADSAAVLNKLLTRPYLAAFNAVYGTTNSSSNPDTVLNNMANAIGQFETEDRSFMLFSSKYDAVQASMANFTQQEANGQLLFFNSRKGACFGCHTPFSVARSAQKPATFTDDDYRIIGVPRNWALPYNNDARAANDLAVLGFGNFLNGAGLGAPNHLYYDLGFCGPMRTDSLLDPTVCGAFRTPALRNVALKGAYFHNGMYSSLNQVIDFYINRDANPQWVYKKADGSLDIPYNDLPTQFQSNITQRPPFTPVVGGRLSPADVQDLLSFLCTLTDGYNPSQPQGYRQPLQCSNATRR